MPQSWRNVARGLPVPELPMPPAGWRTRFFSAALVLSQAQAQLLSRLSRAFLANRQVVVLPEGAEGCSGRGRPCRLAAPPELAARPDGKWSARLEFEVVEEGLTPEDARC